MDGEEEDVMTLLDEEEFHNFNPTVPDDRTWNTGEAINHYTRDAQKIEK